VILKPPLMLSIEHGQSGIDNQTGNGSHARAGSADFPGADRGQALLHTGKTIALISGWNLWFLGSPDRALQRMNSATATDNHTSKSLIGDLNGFAAYICELRRETRQMRARAEARLAIATSFGFVHPAGRSARSILDGPMCSMATWEGGIAKMRAHMSQLRLPAPNI